MTLPSHLDSLSRGDLLRLVADLAQTNTQLQATVADLRAEVADLRAELAARPPAPPGPPAPRRRVAHPKKAGRKPGQGPFRRRAAPPAARYSTPPVEVPVQQTACPACGAALDAAEAEMVTVTDLPAVVRPLVTAYRMHRRGCRRCGRMVRGTHPAVAPDQYGATAHRLGPRLKATAHALHDLYGVPLRRVPALLRLLTGLTVTQGALTQDALRQAEAGVGAAYAALRAAVQASPRVHTDDTGWRVGGQAAYLMVFETAASTVYQIRARHRNEEVRELIPGDYAGVLSADRGRSYDAKALLGVKQQKCLAHLLRGVRELLATKRGKARAFGQKLKTLLPEALRLWHDYRAGPVADYGNRAAGLQLRLSYQLRDRRLVDRDNQRWLDELGRHEDRGNLLRFLDDPRLEPTNNAAERALRPAVIARKVSQGSKNERGAEAFAAFSSVVRTLLKTGGAEGVVEGLCQLVQPITAPHTPA